MVFLRLLSLEAWVAVQIGFTRVGLEATQGRGEHISFNFILEG